MREIIFYKTNLGHDPVGEFLTQLEPGARAGIVADAPVCPVKVLEKDARSGKLMGIARGIRREHLSDSGLHLQGQPGDFAARLPEKITKDAATGN